MRAHDAVLDPAENPVDLLDADVGVQQRHRLLLSKGRVGRADPARRLVAVLEDPVGVRQHAGEAVEPVGLVRGEPVLRLAAREVPPREMEDRAGDVARDLVARLRCLAGCPGPRSPPVPLRRPGSISPFGLIITPFGTIGNAGLGPE
jgi:hypothetical protein